MFKPLVRVIKNIRNFLIEKNHISENLAPSYFLECLLYNVDDECFHSNLNLSIGDILVWLLKHDYSSVDCQNGLTKLFGDDQTQWSTKSASQFLSNIVSFWLA
jgi:hypothetical protein